MRPCQHLNPKSRPQQKRARRCHPCNVTAPSNPTEHKPYIHHCTIFSSITLGTQRPQLEHRIGLTWPRPCLLRPPLRLLTVCDTQSTVTNTENSNHNDEAQKPQSQAEIPTVTLERKKLFEKERNEGWSRRIVL
jgi:hypothetical protein